VSRFFSDSHEALLLNILRDDEINDHELRRLREMLNANSAAEGEDGKR
jgi:predicted transcriptional regulator